MLDTLWKTEKTNDEELYCVYMHINKINGKRYIGQTIQQDNPNHRWNNGKGYINNKYFTNAIQKYGWDNFEHIIIQENLTKEEADELEDLNILFFNTMNNNFGYNLKRGGSCGTLSEEAKQKFRESFTEQVRQKMSESHKGKPSFKKGTKLSEKTKQQISNSLKGRTPWNKDKINCYSEETKQKRSIAQSKSSKNRIWINNGNICKFVKQEELQQYLSDGWKKGRLITKDKETINKK